MFAHVAGGEVTTVADRLPNAARLPDSRAWLLSFPTVSVELREACGWFTVTDAPRPDGTDTTTHDRTVELVAGVPTVVWVERPWTTDELAARTSATIRMQATAALNGNRTFLALAAPTNAQTLAQVKALTQQMNGSIRLALGLLDGTD